MQNIARGWLIYDMTESPMALTWVMLSFMLPSALFSIAGGVVADRMSKKLIMISSQVLNSAATFILAAILLLATAIPFALEGGGATENITSQPTITPENTNIPATVPVTPEIAKNNTNEPSAVIPTEPKPVADTLGIREAREGTPSEPNPFETTDDLLEDLE